MRRAPFTHRRDRCTLAGNKGEHGEGEDEGEHAGVEGEEVLAAEAHENSLESVESQHGLALVSWTLGGERRGRMHM